MILSRFVALWTSRRAVSGLSGPVLSTSTTYLGGLYRHGYLRRGGELDLRHCAPAAQDGGRRHDAAMAYPANDDSWPAAVSDTPVDRHLGTIRDDRRR